LHYAFRKPSPFMTPVVRNVQSLGNHQNPQMCGNSGNSRLCPAKRHISVPAGKRDSSLVGSSVAATIQGQNSTPSSSLNNSHIAYITQWVASTLSATQWRGSNTLTATLGTRSHSPPAPRRTSQTDSTHRIVCSPAFGIACTPTTLSHLETLPTPIPNPEACVIIPNPLRTRATERNQRQRQWQLQPKAVSTPLSMVRGSRSIHRFGNSEMTCLVFATGRLRELRMWNRLPVMSASKLEMVSYGT